MVIQINLVCLVGYERPSTTERVLVNNDDLTNLNLLKIQSAPLGNLGDQAFDGDEMNIFIPQSIQTMIELEEIADVRRQIITPATSVPIIGVVQDSLLGAYNLTQPTMRVDWKDAMNIISYTMIDDFSAFKKDKQYKGTELFSFIVPPKINTKKGDFIVRKGVLDPEHGVLTKAMLGSKKKNSMIHLIWDEYGIEETRMFIDNIQRLVNNFNLINGFSVGIGDIDISLELEDKMNKLFETKKLQVSHLITEMENNPDLMEGALFEESIYSELNTLRETVSKLILENLKPDNNFNIMISSGSKGTDTNMGQMGGCVGQQAVEGKRIQKKVNGRTLCYFHQHDDTAAGRGFIERPYITGMNPTEAIFHNMSSREGLIDTAIKTAESGYVQRKLIKSMEDITIKYDCTVRNSNNNIMQYVYGDNGLDTIKQFQHEFKSLLVGNKKLEETYKFSKDELKKFKFTSEDNDKYIENFKKMRRKLRKSQALVTLDSKVFGAQYMLPINFYRIIENTKEEYPTGDKLEPSYVLKVLDEVMDYSRTQLTCMSKEQIADKTNIKHQDEILSKFVFKYSLHEFLSPKRCIIEYGFNKSQFDYIIKSTVNGFNKAVVEPGEMVGIIAAQSIGEPVTQMSISKDSTVLISGQVEYFGEVGPLIDNLMTKYKKDVKNIGNDSTVLDLKDSYNIMNVSTDEKTTWSRISQVSRHPANGNLVKITTKSGKKVTATLTHSFLKRNTNGVTTVLGSELKVGMRVPVTKYIPEVENAHKTISVNGTQMNLDQEFGWLCGAYIAEGRIDSNRISITNISNEFINRVTNFATKLGITAKVDRTPGEYGPGATTYFNHKDLAKFFLTNFGNGSYNKKIPAFVFSSNKTFINALLRGYFDGDGNINSDPRRSTIRCGSRSEQLMVGINLLLTFNGIVASKLQEKNIYKGEEKVLHTLYIPKKYAQTYKTTIGSNMTDKLKGLNEIIEWNDRECNTSQDNSDKIPELGSTIAKIGKALGLPGQSRTYGRWEKKESIGKRTLEKYIETFEKSIKDNNRFDLKVDMDILTQAVNATVVWDEIVSLEYLNDPKEYVYDFTVPGNQSFMVDSGLLVHNTLNTFHSAGIGGKGTTALGVPRVKELLSISKNLKTPLMQIFLEKKYQHNLDMASKIASYIKYTTIGHLRNKIDVYYDPNPFKEGGFMDKDNVKNVFHSYNPGKHSCQSDITSLPWLMRIAFDREKMMNKEVTLLDIKSKFCNFWESRYANMKGLKKEERVLLEKVTQCSILSNNNNDKTPIIHLRFDMTNFDFGTIVNFTEIFIDNFKLKGITGIDDIHGTPEERMIKLDGDDEQVEVDKEYVIYTKGVNLLELRGINGIDFGRTICNDVAQIYEIFGIEAARASLLREMKIVLEGAGNSVNFQHLSILVDVMTATGSCISIDRHGINKIDTNPFARASFEKTVDQFLTAAVFGEKDSMNSVSSRIMAGLVVKGGTGVCNIRLDTELLEKSEFVEDMEEKYMKTFSGVTQDPVIKDIVEKDEEEEIFMPM